MTQYNYHSIQLIDCDSENNSGKVRIQGPERKQPKIFCFEDYVAVTDWNQSHCQWACASGERPERSLTC